LSKKKCCDSELLTREKRVLFGSYYPTSWNCRNY